MTELGKRIADAMTEKLDEYTCDMPYLSMFCLSNLPPHLQTICRVCFYDIQYVDGEAYILLV